MMHTVLKAFLIGITVFAVVSDAMLMPFYPQFFTTVFGITDPHSVGLYLAACGMTVMLAFPLWAQLSRRVEVLKLLVVTQFAAGVLSLLCYQSDTLSAFWLLSLAMLVFKASYLLIYPYIMRLENKRRHGNTIGLLSVVVHFGAILGAVMGGVVLQFFEPRQAFLVMAGGDFLQMAVCALLLVLKAGQPASEAAGDRPHSEAGRTEADAAGTEAAPHAYVLKLALIMLVFYFSFYLIRPFFAVYWETVSGHEGELAAGLVFAIPALMALLALWFNQRRRHDRGGSDGILAALLWGCAGLLLQASSEISLVLAGRCLYGWALFQATVQLDLLLFRYSSPRHYATDFSKIHFSQSLGALLASYTAGTLVAGYGLSIPFMVAALGFLVTLVLYRQLFKNAIKPARAVPQT